jgi:hypothetical protein
MEGFLAVEGRPGPEVESASWRTAGDARGDFPCKVSGLVVREGAGCVGLELK